MPPISYFNIQRHTRTHQQNQIYVDVDVFPTFEEFRAGYCQRRKVALQNCISLIEEKYLPGLRKRLVKWLKTTIDLQYEEIMWSECFRDGSLHNEIVEHITKRVRQWFEQNGFKISVIYVSPTRFLLRIKLTDGDIPVPIVEEDQRDHIDRISASSSMVDLGLIGDDGSVMSLDIGQVPVTRFERFRRLCPKSTWF